MLMSYELFHLHSVILGMKFWWFMDFRIVMEGFPLLYLIMSLLDHFMLMLIDTHEIVIVSYEFTFPLSNCDV